MKLKVIGLGVLVGILVLGFAFYPSLNMLKTIHATKDSHYGGGVLKEPPLAESEDIYTNTGLVKTSEYKGFDRKMTVYGLTFYVHTSVSDAFVIKVGETMMSMFEKTDTSDLVLQEAVLQNMYKYKAVLPIVMKEKQASGSGAMKMMKENSVCDIIMKTQDHQSNEVLEHLLHAISDVGLSKTLEKDWGFEDSKVKTFMDEAIKEGYYKTKNYASFKGDLRNRVLVQEYAYWLISSMWDLQETYGVGDEEWQLKTPQALKTKARGSYDFVYNSLKSIMQAPKAALLDDL